MLFGHQEMRKRLQMLFQTGSSVSLSAKLVAEELGIRKRAVYDAALEIWGQKPSIDEDRG